VQRLRKKPYSTLLLVSLAFTGVFSLGSLGLGNAQTGLITFLNSDTTWITSSTLSGPVVVGTGVTLTINSGVTVNLNGYYIYVNGTLKSIGTNSQNIFLYGGSITFNASATANSMFENTIINATVSGTKKISLNNNTINAHFTAGDGSILTNNVINAALTLQNGCTLSNNYIFGSVTAGNNTLISGNQVYNNIDAGNSTTVSNNVIDYNKSNMGYIMSFSYTTALKVQSNSVVSNNRINGSVSVYNSNVTNNVISGGGPFTDWVGRPEDATSALEANGNCFITSNVLWSTTGGYGLLTRRVYSYNYNSNQGSYSGYVVAKNNTIRNELRVASDALIENNRIDGGVKVGDIYISAFNEIDYGYGDSVIRGNIITGYGIHSSHSGGSTVIQNNLIVNVTDAIYLKSQATAIRNNTLQNTNTAITLHTGAPTINYNNFINYTIVSILLAGNAADIDASNNYWGQTNVNAINLTVHDLKYDLNVGRVNIAPILDSANPNAPSLTYDLDTPDDPEGWPGVNIPEYVSFGAGILLLIGSISVVLFVAGKKRAAPRQFGHNLGKNMQYT